jgi:TPR repeat protein
MLGVLFYYGRGVAQSYVHAYAWCELAESGGNADATLCRDAALESMTEPDREEAFRLVVELRERQRIKRRSP